jgi:hypothetical protein
MATMLSPEKRVVAILLSALCVVSVASASVEPEPGPAIAGRWSVRWATDQRVADDGTVEVKKMGDATLLIEALGDGRLKGQWEANPTGTWMVEGTRSGANVKLWTVRRGPGASLPGNASVERFDWRGQVAADRIEGMMRISFAGVSFTSPERPWTAKR